MPRSGHADRIRPQRAFTLLELILVMFLLAIVAGFVAPQMSSFIRGRNLNFEARRLLSLTHYAQQRAVSEGVPVVIWFDVKNSSYGIDLVGGSEDGARRISYTAEPGLTFVVTEVDTSVASEDGDERFGLPTVTDILTELEKPGRDPRPEFKTATFQEGIESLADLQPGLILEGVVTNVAAFGAFVDIGVHQDGLVHVSALANKFVKDPHEVVKPGQIVKVKIPRSDSTPNSGTVYLHAPQEKVLGYAQGSIIS